MHYGKSMGDLMLDIFESIKPKKLVMLLLLLCTMTFVMAQGQYNYKGKLYKIETGSKGGHYIKLEDGTKHYLTTITVNPDKKTATYNGKQYTIQYGTKGGRYIMVESKDGTRRKQYIPKEIT